MTKIVHGSHDAGQGHSRSVERSSGNAKSPQRACHWGLFVIWAFSLPVSYLSVTRKSVHAPELNGSSRLPLSDLESRIRTLPPCWPTSTHAPPLPPLRLDLRHWGSRVSIAHSPLF
jgi:hypothetical protein